MHFLLSFRTRTEPVVSLAGQILWTDNIDSIASNRLVFCRIYNCEGLRVHLPEQNSSVLSCHCLVFWNYFLDFGVPSLIKVSETQLLFPSVFPALFSFCSHVLNKVVAMHPCPLKPWGRGEGEPPCWSLNPRLCRLSSNSFCSLKN